jgi:hypothetical protein
MHIDAIGTTATGIAEMPWRLFPKAVSSSF